MLQLWAIDGSPSVSEIFEEGLGYVAGQGHLNMTLKQLVLDLDRHDIDYVVIGGAALLAHGYPRFTVDIDIILTSAGLESFNRDLMGRGYITQSGGGQKSLLSINSHMKIDVITASEFPGDGKPKPVAFPIPPADSVLIEGIRYATLEKLIELKLASGMSASDRLKDLGDVQELIKIRGLDPDFAEKLDPYVRERYLELWRGVKLAGER